MATFLVCGQIAVFASSAAFSQAPLLPGTVEPGRDRPGIVTPSQPNFDFRIETPSRSSVPRAVDDLKFHLADIQVQGAVTIPAQNFRELYNHLIDKDVSLSDILDVSAAIENEYRQRGFALVRAFVPPQRVADGIFTINVVEGFLANVAVEGGSDGTRQRVRNYLQPAIESKPLRLLTVEEGLLLANDIPGVTVSGLLRPSLDTPGASDLVVSVARQRMTGGIAIDNRGSKFSGRWTVTADASLNSVFDDDDQLSGTVTTSSHDIPFGRIAGQARYRRFIGSDGVMVSLIGTVTHGEPGATLRAFNVLTNSWAIGPRITIPVKRTRAESLVVEAGFTVQDARVSILGAPFNHDKWRVLDLGVSYLRSGVMGGSLAGNAIVVQGLPILGATENGSPELSRAGAHTDFTKLTGGLQFTRTLRDSFSISLAGQGQVAFNGLMTGELFAFGGAQIGRGYDPAAITGDDAVGGSIEFRYDHRILDSTVQALQPYVFFDTGKVWNAQAIFGESTINSTGAGLRYWLDYNIFGGIEVARTLTAVSGSDSGKLATRLLLNLTIRV